MTESRCEATADAAGSQSRQNDSVSLVFVGAELVHAVALHEQGSLLVGRMAPSDVLLADQTVSRQHARFTLSQGVLIIEDAGSHNGVLVNGEATRRAVVSPGDRVRIGSVDVIVLGARKLEERDIRELSALRLLTRLTEELDRIRYSQRPISLCALRWLAEAPTPAQLSRATEPLRSIDRWCAHTPNLTLLLLPECDPSAARAMVEAVRGRADTAMVTALVCAPSHGLNAETLLTSVVDLVQREAPGGGTVEPIGMEGRPDGSIVVGAATRSLFDLAARTGHADLPVLVLGETGAGKEIVARAFHEKSRRAEGPFCEVNCAAIAPTLMESILFGHEKGAFTGAEKRSAGLFEQAHGGTLFLDEVGELSQGVQSALLRAIEARRIRRVGGGQEQAVDVRIIAATNRNLRELVAKGHFREDLLYRLEALTVRVPPLRERVDEIEALARLFLYGAATRWGASARALSREALQALTVYGWPGNVRELRNAIERAVAVCAGDVIDLDDLPEHVSAAASLTFGSLPPLPSPFSRTSLTDEVRNFEIARIRAALDEASGNRSQAARLLGLPRRTLGGKLRDYGLE